MLSNLQARRRHFGSEQISRYLKIINMFATRTRLAVRQGTVLQRQFGVSAVAANKAVDPIQKLFLDKLNEYKTKSKAAGGKMVDPSPAIQKEISAELDRVRRVYGGADGTDMTKFPTFKFPEPKVDPINM